ncbi:NAD(P)/FAD-dependent oxidoreductase [soil metagenome]
MMPTAVPEAPPPATANDPESADHEVLIVGSGFSGIGMAIKLKEAGIEDFIVVDKADSVAGTWRENTYPGCVCDVPSHMYSFSFEQNPDWNWMYAPQQEIRDYLERTTDKYGVRRHLRLGVRAVSAEWDAAAGLWRCVGESTDGERIDLAARFVVSGIGGLHVPAKPHLQGIEGFDGPAFHSAEWDHSVDLRGKRIAVIGTGASAIQFVPEIAADAAQLDLYQRTAPYVLPKLDRSISKTERKLFRRFPFLQRLNRWGIYWYVELVMLRAVKSRGFGRFFEKLAIKNLERQVSDPEKRRKLTPEYEFGCKRLLMSNDYYRAIDAPNADVVTDPIAEVGPDSITTADGSRRKVDVIIYGTGFDNQAMASSVEVQGEGGRRLSQEWHETGIEAHRGTMVSGYPNLFFLLGPNTGLGHNSVVFMIECQTRLAIEAIREAQRRGAIGVKAAAQESYNRELQDELEGAVWSRSCKSWYVDARGRNIILWPHSTHRFWRETRELRRSEFDFTRTRNSALSRESVRRLP